MGVLISREDSIVELPNYYWKRIQPFQSRYKQKREKVYSLFINTLTNEEVEQYTLFFSSNNQYQQYLNMFHRRLSDDYLVNTRFITSENIFAFCKYGKMARVYTERIPLRLSDLGCIEESDYLFLLINALKGFQKLYSIIGYFKTSEEMVGLDIQGRVKVWFNPNFSEMQVYQSFEVDMKKRKCRNDQKLMISQIVTMFHRLNGKFFHKQHQQLFELQQEQTFEKAIERLLRYSSSNKIEIKNYFQSILPVFRNNNPPSSDYYREVSYCDFDDQVFEPIHLKNKTIYYINPIQMDENDLKSQNCTQNDVSLSQQLPLNKTNSLILSGQQTSSRINYEQAIPKYNFKIMNRQESKCSSSLNNKKIKFKYQDRLVPASSQKMAVNFSYQRDLSVVVEKQKSCAVSERNCIYQQFGLDKQIISDMAKYLYI